MSASTPTPQLRAYLIELIETCPFDQSNPADCPLCELRKLNPAQRAEWFSALPQRDLMYLAAYHQICYTMKLADSRKDGPAAGQTGGRRKARRRLKNKPG